MAIKSAQSVGGEFVDFRGLAANGPVLGLFRIRQYLPAEPDNYRRNTYPVIADIMICDGPRTGEIHTAENIKFSIAHALRGTTVKDADNGVPPVNGPGEEVAGRIVLVDKPGKNPFIGLDPVSATELAAIENVRAQLGGDNWGLATAGIPAQAAPVPAAAPVPNAVQALAQQQAQAYADQQAAALYAQQQVAAANAAGAAAAQGQPAMAGAPAAGARPWA